MAETAVEVPATVTEKEAPLPPAAAEPELEPQPVVTVEVVEPEKTKLVEPTKKLAPESLVSFKEESNRLSDLSDFQRAALDELRALVRDALNNREFTHAAKAEGQPKETPPAAAQEVPAGTTETTPGDPAVPQPETETLVTELEIVKELASVYETKAEEKPAVESAAAAEGSSLADEVSIWGVPLLKDDRSDVILLKFLRARDFKARDAFAMLKNTISWRREFKIDDLLGEELGDDLEKVVFMHGLDKDGHPVCYNVYGEFQNKDLYQKTFGDEERRTRFLRWRIQFLERTIRKLDFTPGGISTVFQVSDLKNSPGPGKRELRLATKQALQILQDNYPEFVAKQVFINVPWWYLAFYTMISPFLTQRTKSKFVFAGPARTAETLFKYIPPEQVPIQYGGLSVDLCDCNPDFGMDDPATEITVKPLTKQTVEIQVLEKCVIVWELRVVDWEVSYSAEFVPNAEGAYIMVIRKPKKMSPTDEPVVSNSFKVTDLGKIVLIIDNPTSKRKKFVYRFKVKPLSD